MERNNMTNKCNLKMLSRFLLAACLAGGAAVVPAADKPYEPMVGQDGKDVIWVPNPDVMVDKMLDMAQVTARDFVIDLGSGDGRNVIGAAKRGARARGVEFNPDLVEHSRRLAAAAGVPGLAQFEQGDMYAADVSAASVLALFLLPNNLDKLTPKFLDMKPGSRIVSNTYEIPGWAADASETVRDGCAAFCIVFLYVVPARVAGAWRTAEGVIMIEQEFQRIRGVYEYNGINLPLENARLRGAEIQFTANGVVYTGRVEGDSMQGMAEGRSGTLNWRATRQ
jgi:SAM-dependent methyltransferase